MQSTPRARRNGVQVGVCADGSDGGRKQPSQSAQAQERAELPTLLLRQQLQPPSPVPRGCETSSGSAGPEAGGRERSRQSSRGGLEDVSQLREDLAQVQQIQESSNLAQGGILSKALHKEKHKRDLDEQQDDITPLRPLHSRPSITGRPRGGLRGSLKSSEDNSQHGSINGSIISSSGTPAINSVSGTPARRMSVASHDVPSVASTPARRVSVQIRHEVFGEQPENGRSTGRRVTLSLRDETMVEIRDSLQSTSGEEQKRYPKEGRGESLPAMGSNVQGLHPALFPALGKLGDELGDRCRIRDRSRSVDIREDLQQLQRALRDIIPSGREEACVIPAGSNVPTPNVPPPTSGSSSSKSGSARSARARSREKSDRPGSKTARRRNRSALDDLPECGEPPSPSVTTPLIGGSKFQIAASTNSLRDELAFLDSESASKASSTIPSPRGAPGMIGNGSGARLDPNRFPQRRFQRLFTN